MLCFTAAVYGQNITTQKPIMKLVKHSQVNLQEIQSTVFPGGLENEINTKEVFENKLTSPQPTGSESLQNPELLTNEISTVLEIDGPGNLEQIHPPDPCGDIGYNYYVQANNNYFVIYDKQGNETTAPLSFWDFWDYWVQPPPGQSVPYFYSDPIVIFDEVENRWIMCEIGVDLISQENPECYFFLASSSTDNPNLYWDVWIFCTNSYIFDYPKLGNWNDGLYFSANIFQLYYDSGTIYTITIGSAAGAFNKEEMYKGLSDISYDYEILDFTKNNGDPFSLLPLDNDGIYPDETQNIYFVWISDDNKKGYSDDALHFIPATFNGINFDLIEQDVITLNVDNFVSDAGPAYNYSCSHSLGLEVIHDRLLYRAQFRTFKDHFSIVCCHNIETPGVDGMNAMRWYEVRIGSKGMYLYQQGTFTLIGDEFQKRDRWMGSIAMNEQGEIAIGYNVVREYEQNNDNKWIAIGLTGRKPTDPLNQMTFIEELYANNTCYNYLFEPKTVARWGDYSMMSVDPSDGTTFWYTGELPKLYYGEGWISKTIAFELDPCINKLIVQNEIVNSGESINYSAFNLLQAAGDDNFGNGTFFKIHSGGSSNFTSDNLVKLEPGFHSFEGSFFHAVNDYCSLGGDNKGIYYGGSNLANIYVPQKYSGFSNPAENRSVYVTPNLSNGIFTVNSILYAFDKVEIFNMSGEEVYSSNIKGENSFTIDISSNNPGIYFIKFTNKSRVITKKIVLY